MLDFKKEKPRLRSYSVPDQDTTVFLEIKKKYEGIVYKRRISAPYQKMMDYLEHDIPPITKKESMLANTATNELRTELPDDIPDAGTIQILHEIDYFRSYYQGLSPHVFLSYDREAFYDKKGNGFPALPRRVSVDRTVSGRHGISCLCGIICSDPRTRQPDLTCTWGWLPQQTGLHDFTYHNSGRFELYRCFQGSV
ncbi:MULTISPECIES: VTC domain-containing protein [unclassified Clostridium]|uniref:VTC domain-containing protein n=1 Tax=unclassified Clostridium TaxID=2614128 RepID=UPI0015F2FEF6